MNDNLNENNIDNLSEDTTENKSQSIPGVTEAEAADAALLDDVVDEIPEKPFNLKKEAFEWFYTIAIALAIAFVIKGFLFDMVRVSGDSMFPTLYNGDRLIVRKIGYKPKQGDVVILDSNYKNREEYYADKDFSAVKKFFHNLTLKDKDLKKTYYVKRVIALPGQTVDFKDGKVYVDGKQLDESYLRMDIEITDDKIKANGRKLDNSSLESGTVYIDDNDVYYNDGKGRTMLLDESHYDVAERTYNVSEYPMTVKEGHVFVMGDNRSHSLDSRSPVLGQVPYEAIMGEAVFRIWPFNGFGTL